VEHQTTRPEDTPASFQPGFRFLPADAVMLIAAAAFGWWIYDRGPWLAWVTAFVVGNFFLFCNVFRIARALELLWTVIFLTLAAIRLRKGALEWSTIYLSCTALTIALVLIEMRKPSYHGVGWKTINPGLKDWWLKEKGVRSKPEVQPLQAGD
jgi:hypothetical protein